MGVSSVVAGAAIGIVGVELLDAEVTVDDENGAVVALASVDGVAAVVADMGDAGGVSAVGERGDVGAVLALVSIPGGAHHLGRSNHLVLSVGVYCTVEHEYYSLYMVNRTEIDRE